MKQVELDYLTPQKKKISLQARVGLIFAIAPFFLFCVVEFFLFNDETQFNSYQDAAMTVGILGCPIIAVVLGQLALRRMKRDPNLRGRGLAIAALTLGGLWLGFWLFAIGAHVVMWVNSLGT